MKIKKQVAEHVEPHEERNEHMKKSQKIILAVCLAVSVIAIVAIACILAKKPMPIEDGKGGNVNNSGENISENQTNGNNYDGVKSGINGRIENDGYDESEITYKSYDGTKNVEKFVLTNITVGKINGSRCLLLADTKNNSMEFQKSIKVRISVIDENDEVKETFSGIINELAGLEKGKFKAQVLSDITYAKDFKIEVANNM